MYCNYCGNEVKDDAVFCDKCGKSLVQDTIIHETPKTPMEASKPKKKMTLLYIVLAAAVILIGVIVVLAAIGDPVDEAISTVQNGYLGEYTDLMVKDILDASYGLMYENSDWNGGTTNSGDMLVEVKYYDAAEKEDGVTIQFTMLNDDCFKITALVDPFFPAENGTDLFATMNYNYLLAYVNKHEKDADNPQFEAKLIKQLDGICASSVRYGASSAYQGNRAEIHKIAGDDMLSLSVAQLLDAYEMIDLSAYTEYPSMEQSTNVTDYPSSDQDDDEFELYAVINNVQDFLLTDTGEFVGIYDITNIAGQQFDSPLHPTSYAYVDLDQDGIQEVVVELTNRIDGWRLVLHYQDGQVYGYGFNFRAMQSICVDGRIMASSGAADSEVYTMTFDRSNVYTKVNTREDKTTGWLKVDWFDFESDEPLIYG